MFFAVSSSVLYGLFVAFNYHALSTSSDIQSDFNLCASPYDIHIDHCLHHIILSAFEEPDRMATPAIAFQLHLRLRYTPLVHLNMEWPAMFGWQSASGGCGDGLRSFALKPGNSCLVHHMSGSDHGITDTLKFHVWLFPLFYCADLVKMDLALRMRLGRREIYIIYLFI